MKKFWSKIKSHKKMFIHAGILFAILFVSAFIMVGFSTNISLFFYDSFDVKIASSKIRSYGNMLLRHSEAPLLEVIHIFVISLFETFSKKEVFK